VFWALRTLNFFLHCFLPLLNSWLLHGHGHDRGAPARPWYIFSACSMDLVQIRQSISNTTTKKKNVMLGRGLGWPLASSSGRSISSACQCPVVSSTWSMLIQIYQLSYQVSRQPCVFLVAGFIYCLQCATCTATVRWYSTPICKGKPCCVDRVSGCYQLVLVI
jgi:hypothetical protein